MRRVILLGIYTTSICSCWWQAKEPDLVLDKDHAFVESKNDVIIQDISIEQFNSKGGFVALKNIYREATAGGKTKLYLFKENEGYYSTYMDTPFLIDGYTYKIVVQTRGHQDTLQFHTR